MSAVEVIYCAGGNPRFCRAALDAGLLYGLQLPGKAYAPPHFCDQDWRRPNRTRYMAALRRYRPAVATVLDWERNDQLDEVLDWAHEVAEIVGSVVVIPKVQGGVARIPLMIGRASVRLGYSVPTRYGGTELPVWEFAGRPVHLLGGNPHVQMRLARYLRVVSADGNMAQLHAVKWGEVWMNGTSTWPRSRYWCPLRDMGQGHIDNDVPLNAFARSCQNIAQAWKEGTA